MRYSGLEAKLHRLWGAYAYLKDNDLSEVSGTSRLLHEGDMERMLARLGGEMQELAGVLTGEHRHMGMPQDLLLEGSQVCYWLYLAALDAGISFDQLQPHRYLSGAGASEPDVAALAQRLLDAAQLPGSTSFAKHVEEESKETGGHPQTHEGSTWHPLTPVAAGQLLPLLQQALALVGACCAACGLDVEQLAEYDLEQMAGRPYLAGYFADGSGSG